MKTTLWLLFFLFFTGVSQAGVKRIATPFVRHSVDKNVPGLNRQKALFVFEFQNLEVEDLSATIILRKDEGENEEIQLEEGTFQYPVTSGTHQFTIYINDRYFEMYSFPLQIGSREKHVYHITPIKTDGIIIEVDKPVIYLYPETSAPFEISVDPVGEMTFAYPNYEQSWEGNMHPDGSIQVDNETYRYLFWESKQEFSALNPATTAGFVVTKENMIVFLEDKLKKVGFTAAERADFITFWGPQMQQHESVFVTFHQNAECNAFAELNIAPTPDHLQRFYMSWGSYDGNTIPISQELIPFKRNGFTVIEWGGQEIPTINNTLSL